MNTCIVILSFNHPEITARTIRSAMKFSIPIILIHNGSLPKHREKLKLDFPEVSHIEMEINRGYSGGVNFGLNYAYLKYDWVIFLTNDTELLQIASLPLEPAFIAPLIYFRKINRIDSMGGTFTPNQGKLKHIKDQNYKFAYGEFFYVPGTAFILHREIFIKIKQFDESLHTYWEDVDFSMRAQLSKSLVYFNSEFQILHRVGKTCHDNPFYTTYLYQRNRRKISWKYCPFIFKPILILQLMRDFLKQLIKLFNTKDKSRFILYLRSLRE
jgi:GT2 family glycosyltransferase